MDKVRLRGLRQNLCLRQPVFGVAFRRTSRFCSFSCGLLEEKPPRFYNRHFPAVEFTLILFDKRFLGRFSFTENPPKNQFCLLFTNCAYDLGRFGDFQYKRGAES